MTFDLNAHRASVEAWLVRLVREGGRGWHDYVKHQAKRFAHDDPGLFEDLPAAVDAAIAESAPQRAATPTTRRP